MKTKHLLMTRFFPFQHPDYVKDTGDPDFLVEQAHLFKENLIVSLGNQTNKNTTLVVIVNGKTYYENKLAAEIIDGLKLISPVETKILPCEGDETENGFSQRETYQAYIKNMESKYDFLVETRTDFDDLFYCDAIEQAINLIDQNPFGITAHGYCRGITYVSNSEMYEFNFFSDKQQRLGVWSVFASLVVNCSDIVKKPFTSIYNFNHGQLGLNLQQYGDKNGVDVRFIQDPLIDAFVYVRHNAALSNHGTGEISIPDYAKIRQLDMGECIKYTSEIFPFRFGKKQCDMSC